MTPAEAIAHLRGLMDRVTPGQTFTTEDAENLHVALYDSAPALLDVAKAADEFFESIYSVNAIPDGTDWPMNKEVEAIYAALRRLAESVS